MALAVRRPRTAGRRPGQPRLRRAACRRPGRARAGRIVGPVAIVPAPMAKTVILSTARTPFGKMGGGLASLDATDLGGTAISEALDRAEVEPDQVEGVVYGQVLQAGQGQIPSR